MEKYRCVKYAHRGLHDKEKAENSMSAFRAAKDVKFPMYVSMISMWVFRVAGAYILALETVSVFGLFEFSGFGMGIMGVWVAMIIDWIFRTTLYVIRYFTGRWLKADKKKNNKLKETEVKVAE